MSQKKTKKRRRPPPTTPEAERSGRPAALVTLLQVTQIILTVLRIFVDR
jgi:hypothetical protein